MSKPTICANCKHKHFLGPIWYSQFCGAAENKQQLNVVTGCMEYEGHNPHKYCRDVNDGNCELFEEA